MPLLPIPLPLLHLSSLLPLPLLLITPPMHMLRRAHHPHRHKLMPRMPRRCW
ncbi:hypothetical protein M422DRAFT_32933 [Sphaerobolus stellatus SS14]|uniref:Uncharacterized protein n=1 Tax=Sphaerobolus stellatus (strain SS14) TaxID=990650 RepID=A0A0C9U7W0_SPHS4|nr:hypothetical protein M422DRAFT_32933 [Sphaerobolus stellatus SS14]